MIVTSLMITDRQIPMPQELLLRAPLPPHAVSSSSVLIFIASNGGRLVFIHPVCGTKLLAKKKPSWYVFYGAVSFGVGLL